MKLVIEVSKEDYKRYKEDKVCSYASAVLDAVPLNEVLDEIRAEISKLKGTFPNEYYLKIIDKYREENK